jgi:hypothetical protein
MPTSEFDRENVLAEERPSAEREREAARPRELEWASSLGNSAVQRIAHSSAGRRTPVGPGVLPLATGALARQAKDEEEDEAGGGDATATAEAPPATAEAAGAESSAPEATPAGGEELLEEDE